MRILVLLLTLVAVPAIASPPRSPLMSECLTFEPTPTEVEESRSAYDSIIPENATLQSACTYYWLSLETSVSLKETHYYQYFFTWPVDDRIDGLSFYQNAACLRQEQKLLSCMPRPPSARLENGEPFTYSGDIIQTELKELLDHFQALSVPKAPIIEIWKQNVDHSSDKNIVKTIYRIVVAEDEGEFAYRVEHNCRSYNKCDWRIDYVGKLSRV